MAFTDINHRLNGKCHTGFKHETSITAAVVQDLGVIVKNSPNTMPAILSYNGISVLFCMNLDGVSNLLRMQTFN